MAVTTGASASPINGPGAPGQTTSIAPALQAQDGSFVGTVWVGDWDDTYMVAFDASGNVRWSVPNDQPQLATADGGVIGQSGITYDQNGNATGMIANLPTQSWRGNAYQVGSVDQIVAALSNAATSLWAHLGGSPSGNGTAARPWNLKLVWQNAFSLYPDNPQYLPNLAIDATSQAATIKSAALAAFKKAFVSYPVNGSEGSANTGDNRANVSTSSPQSLCGNSSPFPGSHDSQVFYTANMEQAQWALPIQLYTAQDVQNALNSVALMKAIGAGIGNNAAHEVAHQFLLAGYGMDDASTNTYNGQGCDGGRAPWVYGFGPISWESVTANALQSALGGGGRQ
jgi:hypothetical protein